MEFENQILLGACLDVLKAIPDNTYDAVVTDPPYGLGKREPKPDEILAYLQGAESLGPLKQGPQYCANSILRSAVIPQAGDSKAEVLEDLVTFRIVVPKLTVVPTRLVQLDNQLPVGEQEVNHEGPILQLDDMLVGEGDPHSGERFRDCQLSLREREGFSGCVKTCSCFTQTGPTSFRILVGFDDFSFGKSKASAGVVTPSTTEVRAVLTLDVGRRTGEIVPADPTDPTDLGLLLTPSQEVGALSGASRLLSLIQVLLTGQVGLPADRAFSFNIALPAALLDRFHSPRVAQKDFMNKDWEIPSVLVWKELYRVLKPGGYVLSFGGTRTWDLISMGARMAGFEKCPDFADDNAGLQWIQSQGMPKSYNVALGIDEKMGHEREAKAPPISPEAQEWSGWGTGLKPTWEPILVLFKPMSEKTIAANVLKHGTGVINIDATRVKHANKEDFEDHKAQVEAVQARGGVRGNSWKNASDLSGANDVSLLGRWPADVLFTHAPGCKKHEDANTNMWACVEGCPVAALDSQSGDRPGMPKTKKRKGKSKQFFGQMDGEGDDATKSPGYGDSGGISRVFAQFEAPAAPFFYTGKASKKEVTLDGEIENDHPTKKPVALMRWLIRLVVRKGGLILDPYCGSGSTLHAAFEERVRYTGIEKDPHNHGIAVARMVIVAEIVGAKQNSQDNFDLWMNLPEDE